MMSNCQDKLVLIIQIAQMLLSSNLNGVVSQTYWGRNNAIVDGGLVYQYCVINIKRFVS